MQIVTERAERDAAAAEPFVIWCDLDRWITEGGRRRLLIAGGLILAVALFGGVRGMVILALIVVVGILIYLCLSSQRVTCDDGGIEYRNAIGRRTRLGYDEIDSAVLFEQFYGRGVGKWVRLSIANTVGREPIVLDSTSWSEDDMRALFAILAVHVRTDTRGGQQFWTRVRDQSPQYASFMDRHPGRALALALPVFVVLAVLATLVMGML